MAPERLREIQVLESGDVAVGSRHVVLASSPLGSCVAVALAVPGGRLAGMAHVMLPGRCPNPERTTASKYADDAIDILVDRMTDNGAPVSALHACAIGGANVLERDDDTIAADNVRSVLAALARHGIPLVHHDLGGTRRRQMTCDIEFGRVRGTVASGPEVTLWNFMEPLCR